MLTMTLSSDGDGWRVADTWLIHGPWLHPRWWSKAEKIKSMAPAAHFGCLNWEILTVYKPNRDHPKKIQAILTELCSAPSFKSMNGLHATWSGSIFSWRSEGKRSIAGYSRQARTRRSCSQLLRRVKLWDLSPRWPCKRWRVEMLTTTTLSSRIHIQIWPVSNCPILQLRSTECVSLV